MNIDYKKTVLLVATLFMFGHGIADEDKHWRDKEYYDVTYYTDTVIDAPIEKVWPHALNTRAWLNDLHTETVFGEVGTVGHIERVTPPGSLDDDLSLRNYHYDKLTEVIPNRLFTLKVFFEKGGSYCGLNTMSFDTFMLSEDNGKTRVSMIYNAEHPRHGKTDAEIEKTNRLRADRFDVRFVKFWSKLEKLVNP